MQYLLHAPSRLNVFVTRDRTIARFLRHKHHWAAIKTEYDELPEYVSTSCILEYEDHGLTIDKVALDDGKSIVEQVVGLLVRDGFRDPDLAYVGRLIRKPEGVRRPEEGNCNVGEERDLESYIR